MTEGDKPLTLAGNRTRPLIPVVIVWAKTAWERIPIEMVPKSYLKCGISNKRILIILLDRKFFKNW